MVRPWLRSLFLVAAVLLAGCLGGPDGAPESGSEGDDPAQNEQGEAENETVEGPEPVPLPSEGRYELHGPGPREFLFNSSENFTLRQVSYHNPDQVPVDELEFWILLVPMGWENETREECFEVSGAVFLWHNTMQAGNLFWSDLSPGEYRLVYGTPNGTRLDVDIYQGDYTGEPSRRNVSVSPTDFEAKVQGPVEGSGEADTGVGVEGGLVHDVVLDKPGVLFVRFAVNGLNFGGGEIEMQVHEDTGDLCTQKEASGNLFFSGELRSTVRSQENKTLQWSGSYRAEVGAFSRPQVSLVLVEWEEAPEP